MPCNHLFEYIPIILDESNSFWSAPNHTGRVQIIKRLSRKIWFEPELDNWHLEKFNSTFSFLLSEFTGCENEDALISQYKVAQNDNQTLVIAGIVFNDDFDYIGNGDDKKMPDLDYKIRMDSRDVVDLTQFTFTPYPMPPGPGRLFSKYLWSWDRSL